MREVKADEARRRLRDLLDEVERSPDAAITIKRYDRPVAVLVSAAWHKRAESALKEAGQQ